MKHHSRLLPSLAAALLAASASLSLPALAVTQDCTNAQTQADMNACAGADLKREDAHLNQLYRDLNAKLPAERRTALRDVQRAWLLYRDKHCAFQAAPSKGGSMQGMAASACLTEQTRQRSQALQQLLDDASR